MDARGPRGKRDVESGDAWIGDGVGVESAVEELFQAVMGEFLGGNRDFEHIDIDDKGE